MASFVTHTIIDHSGERSFTRHWLPDVTNANYILTTGNTPGTQNVGSLRVALGAVCNGNFVKHSVTTHQERNTPVPPTDENAQREIKLQLHCTDNAVRRFTIEIPCPNLALLAVAGTDVVDDSVLAYADLVDKLQTYTVSPWGNPFLVDYGRIVGRRL